MLADRSFRMGYSPTEHFRDFQMSINVFELQAICHETVSDWSGDPERPSRNFRASWSGNWWILCTLRDLETDLEPAKLLKGRAGFRQITFKIWASCIRIPDQTFYKLTKNCRSKEFEALVLCKVRSGRWFCFCCRWHLEFSSSNKGRLYLKREREKERDSKLQKRCMFSKRELLSCNEFGLFFASFFLVSTSSFFFFARVPKKYISLVDECLFFVVLSRMRAKVNFTFETQSSMLNPNCT